MMHGVEMRDGGEFDLRPKGDRRIPLERVYISVGEVLIGQVRCYVTESDLVERADIALADGLGILEGVPCAYFQFLDRKRDEEL